MPFLLQLIKISLMIILLLWLAVKEMMTMMHSKSLEVSCA
ncbi:hypothetical protein KR49_00090 [Synechococcus sp. KORDI-49]|nr:hypothetical protein KR49_00090 [Synechococcus sp. KORDI-49]